MIKFISEYWLEAVFGGILALLGLAYRQLSSRLKRQDAVGLGVQALLRDRIIQAYNHYMEKQYCPIYGLENVEKLYEQYHALGGNGAVTKLLKDIRELPTDKEEH